MIVRFEAERTPDDKRVFSMQFLDDNEVPIKPEWVRIDKSQMLNFAQAIQQAVDTLDTDSYPSEIYPLGLSL